jgi:carbon-monoxide dehydrogenase medium subunit
MEFARVRSVPECLALLAAGDPDRSTKVIAGGQSLLPLIHLGLAAPTHLVDINDLTELDDLYLGDDHLQIGALVHHDRLAADPLVARHAPVLAAAAGHIGHVAIRNRGTIGGSVVHCDPAAELPATLLLLDATIVCLSAARGARRVPVAGFLAGPYSSNLEDDELLAWIEVPGHRPGSRFGFYEFALRHGDYASAGAVCRLEVDGTTVRSARAVLFAVASTPIDVSPALEPIAGRELSELPWAEVAHAAVPPGPQQRLGRTVLARALREAAA